MLCTASRCGVDHFFSCCSFLVKGKPSCTIATRYGCQESVWLGILQRFCMIKMSEKKTVSDKSAGQSWSFWKNYLLLEQQERKNRLVKLHKIHFCVPVRAEQNWTRRKIEDAQQDKRVDAEIYVPTARMAAFWWTGAGDITKWKNRQRGTKRMKSEEEKRKWTFMKRKKRRK